MTQMGVILRKGTLVHIGEPGSDSVKVPGPPFGVDILQVSQDPGAQKSGFGQSRSNPKGYFQWGLY